MGSSCPLSRPFVAGCRNLQRWLRRRSTWRWLGGVSAMARAPRADLERSPGHLRRAGRADRRRGRPRHRPALARRHRRVVGQGEAAQGARRRRGAASAVARRARHERGARLVRRRSTRTSSTTSRATRCRGRRYRSPSDARSWRPRATRTSCASPIAACSCAIAARDLTALTSFEESSAELADLAMATLGAALRIARADEQDADTCRLAVIAMGKTGGRELNYLSDVDVVFVHEPAEGADEQKAVEAATRLAAATMRLCSEHTAEGVIWEVDANLRPEGRDGALVRTLASHVSYYERWAATWEFQALLKARFAAGDEELAQAYLDAVSPMVWEVSTARELRAGRPGDAPPRRREHPVAAPRPRAQARRRRLARRRVRGSAPPARARPRRRLAAQPHHAAGACRR